MKGVKHYMRITIKAARVNKGMTQAALADKLNVTKKTVCSWEKGKTMPKLDKIEPLCNVLGVQYNDIQWRV